MCVDISDVTSKKIFSWTKEEYHVLEHSCIGFIFGGCLSQESVQQFKYIFLLFDLIWVV